MYPSDTVYDPDEPVNNLLRGFLVVRVRVLFYLSLLFTIILVTGIATFYY
ncbi:MAG TPA: hypothetical protein VGO47_08015 [Chlamydiales bacterium]|nr:hypothetical protein [Chlamydiales bacterium]